MSRGVSLEGDKARVLLSALASAGTSLTLGELRDRGGVEVDPNYAREVIRSALAAGLLVQEGPGSRSTRYRILPKAYGVWVSRYGVDTGFGTGFAPVSSAYGVATPVAKRNAAAASPFVPDEPRTAGTGFDVQAITAHVLAVISARLNGGTEGGGANGAPSRQVPAVELSPELDLLAEWVIARERRKPSEGFRATIRHRIATDERYRKATAQAKDRAEAAKATTSAPSPVPSVEKAAADRARAERIRAARARLPEPFLEEARALALEQARAELGDSSDQRVRLRALDLEHELVLDEAARLIDEERARSSA